MTKKGPVQIEIEALLVAAFPGGAIEVINDSLQHRGHGGDDGSGESHFTVALTWHGFAGVKRIMRQRMVNKALGNLPGERVHALAIRARTPSETSTATGD